MGKIILFPENRVVRKFIDDKETSIEKIQTWGEQVETYIQQVISSLKHDLVKSNELRVDLNKNFDKDFSLIEEAFRSCIYRCYGDNHPLQNMIDNGDFKDSVQIVVKPNIEPPDIIA
ncbi:MAG: hypothetical protein WD512_19615 [Candidatus Paceibacterota bacterium]